MELGMKPFHKSTLPVKIDVFKVTYPYLKVVHDNNGHAHNLAVLQENVCDQKNVTTPGLQL